MAIETTGPFEATDASYFVVESSQIKGSLHAVADATERDLIPDARREEGMLVYLRDEATYYKLEGGILNANWVVLSLGEAGVAPEHLYLDPVGGDDANDGLTPGTTVQTLTRIDELIPRVLTSHVIVHCASGNVRAVNNPQRIMYGNGMLTLIGDGAGQAGQDGFDEVATGVTSANSVEAWELIVAGPLTIDQYVGYTIEITSGTFTGYRRLVAHNTATSIRMARRINGSTDFLPAGTTFRILRPNFQIQEPSGVATGVNYNVGSNGVFNLVNLRFRGTFITIRPNFPNSLVQAFGLSCTDGAGGGFAPISGNNILLSMGGDAPGATYYTIALFAAFGVTGAQWYGWGATGHEGGILPTYGTVFQSVKSDAILNGFIVGTQFLSFSREAAQFFGGNISRGGVSGNASMLLTPGSGYFNLGAFQSIDIDSGGLLDIESSGSGALTQCDVQQGNSLFVLGSGGKLRILGTGRFQFNRASRFITATGPDVLIDIQGGANTTITSTTDFMFTCEGAEVKLGSGVVCSGVRSSFTNCTVSCSAAFTLNSTVGDALALQSTRFAQAAGTVSCTSGPGVAMNCTRGSNVMASGAGSTVLSGGTYGASCTGLSKIDFNGSPVNVTGTTADFLVGSTAFADTLLAAAGDVVEDAGNVVGRSA